MTLNLRDKQWWLGLLVSFLRGGWGALAGGGSVAIVDPEHFNASLAGLGHIGLMMLMSFIGAGLIHAFSYLVAKPVPPSIEDELAPEDKVGAVAVTPGSAPGSAPSSEAPPCK